jgi:hypothetical protein
MKCYTNDNSTSSTQLPHNFSYIVAILGHNHFESPNMFDCEVTLHLDTKLIDSKNYHNFKVFCFCCGYEVVYYYLFENEL